MRELRGSEAAAVPAPAGAPGGGSAAHPHATRLLLQMSWDDLSKNDMLWPSVREVWDYRRRAYKVVRAHLAAHPALDALPVTWVRRAATAGRRRERWRGARRGRGVWMRRPDWAARGLPSARALPARAPATRPRAPARLLMHPPLWSAVLPRLGLLHGHGARAHPP